MAVICVLLPLMATLITDSRALETAASCADEYATSASATLQGQPRDFEKYLPPYKFAFTDSLGRSTSEYTEEVFTVRLSGEVPFRGFAIQARLATQQGFVIGHLTAGQFAEEPRWELQGVKFQQCPNARNSSITNANDDEKYAVEAKWQTLKKEGPIQFVVTVIQTEETYWTLWQPQSGFIVPSKNAKFLDQRSAVQEEISDADLVTQPSDESNSSDKVSVPRFNIALGSDKRVSIRVVDPEEARKDNKFPVPSVLRGENRNFPGPPVFNKEGNVESEPQSQSNNVQVDAVGSVSATPEAVISTTLAPQLPLCDAGLCNNNGTCRGYPKENRYLCICTELWTGQHCDEPNYCHKNKCESGALCISNKETGDYTCECHGEWAGEFCERPCPAYLCQNGGNCTISKEGEYGCACPKGYSGKHCETDIDDCAYARCQNGATCMDKLNDFECHCTPGYMGERCHRPCQDIYKSCEFWNEQDRCESMRPATKFFDINCAVTCGQCRFDNSTVTTDIPLPPLLEPFEFLLGKWSVNWTGSQHRFPLDFANATGGYFETLEFTSTPVTMFGTPSLNFSARAYNLLDPRDEKITVGFVTLGAGAKPLKVSFMHTGNDGMTIVEEGEMEGSRLSLEMVYLAVSPGVESIAPTEAVRHWAIKGAYLQETVERNGTQGRVDRFTKYFFRETRFSY